MSLKRAPHLLMIVALLATPALAQGQDSPAPKDAKPAQGTTPAAAPEAFQALGAFPTNEITARPYVGPQNGEKGLKETVAALQRTLTELQQLELQLKEAHWNVSGAEFYQLHIELQKHFEGVVKLADMVAQRLLAIGASADGRATTIVRTSRVPEIPGGYIDDAQVVAWFTDTYKLVGDETRQAIYDTEKDDPTTSNLLQTVESTIDEYQWQMRAFLQNTQTDRNTGWSMNHGRPVLTPGGQPGTVPNTVQGPDGQDGQPGGQ